MSEAVVSGSDAAGLACRVVRGERVATAVVSTSPAGLAVVRALR
jgi:hypothetical protein